MWSKVARINQGHAQLPVVVPIKENTFRIFVTDRFSDNRSFIRRFDFDVKTKKTTNHNFFSSGIPNNFDEDGTMTSCLVDNKLYYTGWKKLDNKKYKQSIGFINTDLDNAFDRKIVIDSSIEDENLCCSPFVVKEDYWKMWFICGKNCGGWTPFGPKYTIRYAESHDGENWNQKEIIFSRKQNEVFSRPFVKFHKGVWQMWYSYLYLNKNKKYKIGYAESKNGIDWKRLDELVGIDVSKEGWDSQSVAFPYIVEYNKKYLMFYSGNEFGKTGVGYAESI